MNIHALDRPLVMGNQEQISIIKTLEAGWWPCPKCGTLYPPETPEDMAWMMSEQAGMCRSCRKKGHPEDET